LDDVGDEVGISKSSQYKQPLLSHALVRKTGKIDYDFEKGAAYKIQ
jgi:hypothetical protein